MFALISEARGHGGHGHGMSSKPHVALTIQLSLHPGPQWSILPALAPAVWTAKGSAPRVVDKISMSCVPGRDARKSGTQVNAVVQNLGTLVSRYGVHTQQQSAVSKMGISVQSAKNAASGNNGDGNQQTQHKHCCSPS